MNNKSILYPLIIVAIVLVSVAAFGCSPDKNNSVVGPVITSLAAEHEAIYPVGNTRITCAATTKNGDVLNYQWVSNSGKIIGSGQTITWEAPPTYGDFNIMCTVYDSQGNKASETVTVAVIVRDASQPSCCR